MARLLILVLIAVAAAFSISAAQESQPAVPAPQDADHPRRNVTVQELIQSNHRLTIRAGTEVVWSDPHFGRVWFPSGGENPRIERTEQGFLDDIRNAPDFRRGHSSAGPRGNNPWPIGSRRFRWPHALVANRRRPPTRVFVVHGDPAPARALATRIEKELGWAVSVAVYRDSAVIE